MKKPNFFSRWLFSFIYPILKLANKRVKEKKTLDLSDLADLPAEIEPAKVINDYQIIYKQQPHIFKSLARHAGAFGLGAYIMYFTTCVMQYGGTYCLKYILLALQDKSKYPAYLTYVLALALFLIYLIRTFCLQHCFDRLNTLNVKFNASLFGTVLNKTFRLSAASRNLNTMGKIINLMTIDSVIIAQFVQSFHFIWITPLHVIAASVLIGYEVGIHVFSGMAVMILGAVLQSQVSNRWVSYRREWVKYTDMKSKKINEYLMGIRVVKYNAWEKSAYKAIEELRIKEIRLYYKAAVCRGVTECIFLLFPILMLYAIIGSYCGQNGMDSLSSAKMFTLMNLVNILSMPLNSLVMVLFFLSSMQVSSKRVGAYLDCVEIENYNIKDSNLEIGAIEINDGSFAWSSKETIEKSKKFQSLSLNAKKMEKKKAAKKEEDYKDDSSTLINRTNISSPSSPTPLKEKSQEKEAIYTTLYDINLNIKPKEFVAIVGEVGSGKSSLVSSVIGELIKEKGSIRINGSVRIVPQTAWIINGTLKHNIVMFNPYNEELFNHVLKVCELVTDLTNLSNGVETEIGSRGINLSGGQKQRVSLARALYANPDIYIIDDCLSALDAQVSASVYENVIKKDMTGKTVLFVTNNIHLLSDVKHIVVMRKGRIVEEGSYIDLRAKNGEFSRLAQQLVEAEKQKEEEEKKAEELNPVRKGSTINKKREQGKVSTATGDNKGNLIIKEEQRIGSVKLKTYFLVIKYGGIFLGVLGLMLYLLDAVARILTQWWMSAWSSDQFSQKLTFYIYIYAIISVIAGLIIVLRGVIFSLFVNQLSKKSQLSLFDSVLKCPLSWFDITPTGRIMNRLIKDQEDVDNSLPMQLGFTLRIMCMVVAGLVFIGALLPWFFIPLAACIALYVVFYKISIQACRDTKRLDSIMKSPIFSTFTEILEGITSIRVSAEISKFNEKFIASIKNSSIAFLNNMICQRWINIRIEILGDIIIGIVTLIVAILNNTIISPKDISQAGMAITKAIECMGYMAFMLRALGDLEQQMSSFERIIDYIEETPSEKLQVDKIPPADWPQEGKVELQNISYKYREGLQIVINSISLEVPPRMKVGIVGRTGSGKSTLTLGMLRILEPLQTEGRKIMIDGVDIEQISLYELRKRIAIIPQDPVLFSGTLRSNIDPFNWYKNDEIFEMLRKLKIADIVQRKIDASEGKAHPANDIAHLEQIVISIENSNKVLEFTVQEGGSNFSLGERQLICLSRALIKKPRLLLMDEATASIDEATDKQIQEIIKEEFKQSTVMTIAHRIRTIIDYDKILVLDSGKIKEFDSPTTLLNNENSEFCKLIKENGQEFLDEMKQILSITNQVNK